VKLGLLPAASQRQRWPTNTARGALVLASTHLGALIRDSAAPHGSALEHPRQLTHHKVDFAAFHPLGVTGDAKFKRLWQGFKLTGPEGRLNLERQHCNGAAGRFSGRRGMPARGPNL